MPREYNLSPPHDKTSKTQRRTSQVNFLREALSTPPTYPPFGSLFPTITPSYSRI